MQIEFEFELRFTSLATSNVLDMPQLKCSDCMHTVEQSRLTYTSY